MTTEMLCTKLRDVWTKTVGLIQKHSVGHACRPDGDYRGYTCDIIVSRGYAGVRSHAESVGVMRSQEEFPKPALQNASCSFMFCHSDISGI